MFLLIFKVGYKSSTESRCLSSELANVNICKFREIVSIFEIKTNYLKEKNKCCICMPNVRSINDCTKTIVIIRLSLPKWLYEEKMLCAVTEMFPWCYAKKQEFTSQSNY